MIDGLAVCRDYLGLDKVKDKQQIMMLLASQAIDHDIVVDPSTTPWCAAWMNFCERSVGNKGTGHVNARSFLNYGEAVSLLKSQTGDIVVFDFEHDGVHGHVTYLVDVDTENQLVVCTGGNQQNIVGTDKYPIECIAGIRRVSN